MPANVESMFYVSNEANQRFVPWHGLGTSVDHAVTSQEALELAHLNWNVIPHPIYTETGMKIPGYVANTRDSDNSVLGIVTDKYKIVQNSEAFQFTDNLIGDEVKYETAGSLRNGKNVWLLAKLPKEKILGDEIAPYVCFSNTHDGSGAIRVFMTPIRVVCNNTLNLALNTARRTWSCKHMGNIESKLVEASRTLELANKYMVDLNQTAERLANTSISDERVHEIVEEMFPINTDSTDRVNANMKKAKTEFMVCCYMPDILKFKNTAWGLVNAASDFMSHTSPLRGSETYQERNFERIINGHPILDAILEKCSVKA